MTKPEYYFNAYPLSNVCYETSNGLLFHEKSDAHTHAALLTDKTVNTHKRTKANAREKAADLIKTMQASETLQALKNSLPEKEKRRSVLAAYNKKLQSLQATEQSIDTSKI
jgi:hypothetical protein